MTQVSSASSSDLSSNNECCIGVSSGGSTFLHETRGSYALMAEGTGHSLVGRPMESTRLNGSALDASPGTYQL